MGRSMARVTEANRVERFDRAAHNPFMSSPYEFMIEENGEHLYANVTRRDRSDQAVFTMRQELTFAVGSGEHGRAYFSWHDDFVFQSPVNWFTRAARWDLAPNLVGESHDQMFRPIQAVCVFCHADRAEPDETTTNHYLSQLPAHPAIGCERCHGPGSRHVASRTAGEAGLDETIVNPRRLESYLREAVCEQCHLQGEVRILRAGRRTFDFRPGLPLHDFWTIFEPKPGIGQGTKAVGHVEQMHASRCFLASDGKLGCISCHDPHSLPGPKEAAAFYRTRCLTCHKETSCRLAPPVRQGKNGDSCTACHMPRIAPTDIAHSAITDHRVPRTPDKAPKVTKPNQEIVPHVPLVHFHENLPPRGEAGLRRDLALAIVQIVEELPAADPNRRAYASSAVPLLTAAFDASQTDVPALEGLGFVLWLLDQKSDAAFAFDTALRVQPQQEKVLARAGALAAAMGRSQAAIDYWRRAVKVNPWMPTYHFGLAKALAATRDLPGALAECRTAIGLNPAIVDFRLLLLDCLLSQGDVDATRKEFTELLRLDPPNRAELEQKFHELDGNRPMR
jgi:predicted CXXCH cytochrome family protein